MERGPVPLNEADLGGPDGAPGQDPPADHPPPLTSYSDFNAKCANPDL